MIFITGYPRSGTTLISNKIGQISSIYIGPETNYFRKFYNKRNISNDTFVKNALDDKRLADFNLTEREILECCKKSNYNKEVFLYEFLKLAAFKNNPTNSCIIEKSPAHILYYERILKYNKDAKFIFITRDPRDVIASNLKVDWIHSNIFKHAVSYKLYCLKFKELKAKHPEKVMLLRYEDFLHSEELLIKKSLNFINPNSSLDMTKKELIDTVPDWEMKWKSESLKPVDKTKLHLWKTVKNLRIEKVVQYILSEELEYFDYEKTDHKIGFDIRFNSKLYNNPFYKNLLLFRRMYFS